MKKTLTKMKLLMGASFICSTAFAQWTPQSTGFTTPLRGVSSIAIPSASVVWIAADSVKNINGPIQDFARTTNGGTSWKKGKIAGYSKFNFGNIEAIDSNIAWVSMYNTLGTNGGGVFKTTDGGTTWTMQTNTATQFAGASAFIDFLHFFDANNGVAVGDPNGGYFEIYTTTNGGGTWTRVAQANIPANLAMEYGTVNLYAYVGNTIWFATTKGNVYKSTDKGNTWTVATTGAAALNQIAFTDANNGLTANFNNGSVLLYKTTDGGITWNPLNYSGHTFFYYCNVPGTPGMYVSSGNSSTGQGSSYSTDYGTHWTTLDSANYHSVSAFLNANVGWSGSYNYSTTEHGIFKWTGLCSQKPTLIATPGFCPGQTTPVTLSANTGAGLTYQWYKNGLAIAGAITSTYIVTNTTLGDYNFIMSNGTCSNISPVRTILQQTASPSVTITFASTPTLCSVLRLTSITPTVNVYFQWQMNGTPIAGTQNTVSYTATAAGTYTVIVGDGSSCTANSNSIVINNTGAPVAKFSYTLNGRTITVKDTSSYGVSYKWYYGDGSIDSVRKPLPHIYANKSNYTVCLKIKNACGDTSSSCITVQVTGMNEIMNKASLSIYPNPAESQLMVGADFNNSTTVYLEVTDLLGKTIIKTDKLSANGQFQHAIDVSGLGQGIYLLKISTAEGSNMVQKFVKQ